MKNTKMLLHYYLVLYMDFQNVCSIQVEILNTQLFNRVHLEASLKAESHYTIKLKVIANKLCVTKLIKYLI